MTPRVEVIGDATLYLADCRDVLPLLSGVDAVVTDPPFGMEFCSNHRGSRWGRIVGDNDRSLLQTAASILVSHSRYVFCRWGDIPSLPQPKSIVTWVKNNWSMGDLSHEHARQTETICFWPGPNHYFPHYRPSDVIEAVRTGNDNHPTEKPHMLMCAIIEWTAGTVLDPFMGSGTTGTAAVRLGRPFIGIEIDERHFDVACRRIEQAKREPDLLSLLPVPVDPSEVRTRDLFAEPTP